LALLGSGAPLLEKLVSMKAKEIKLTSSLTELLQAVSASWPSEQKLHLVSLVDATLADSAIPVQLERKVLAVSKSAVSVHLQYKQPDGTDVEPATVNMAAVKSVSVAAAQADGLKHVCCVTSVLLFKVCETQMLHCAVMRQVCSMILCVCLSSSGSMDAGVHHRCRDEGLQ
jgi:hypothetical protein